jgi:chemotaxis protein MotB
MREKPNEWIAISDLMAGVVAVVMLLLIVSVVQQAYAEIKHKQELEKGVNAQQKVATKVLQKIQASFDEIGVGDLVEFDMVNHKLTLKDSVFTRGSACITPKAQLALIKVQQQIADYLDQVNNGKIIVEGHTDSFPVSQPVIDFKKCCAVYDDNYTLSAARAREARKLLIGLLSQVNAKRVIVAGYGDSHPLPNIPVSDGKNRRVEIVFLLQE